MSKTEYKDPIDIFHKILHQLNKLSDREKYNRVHFPCIYFDEDALNRDGDFSQSRKNKCIDEDEIGAQKYCSYLYHNKLFRMKNLVNTAIIIFMNQLI